MNGLKAALLAGAALLATAGSSQALTASGGSVTYTGLTDYSVKIGDLALFNPAAGTLTAVTFTAGYGFNSTITVTANTPSNGNVSTESAANFQTANKTLQAILDKLINNKGTAVIGSAQLTPTAYDYTGPKTIYNLGANSSAQYTSNVPATSANYTDTDAGDLSAFYANATTNLLDIYGQTLTGLNLTQTGGNASATQTTTATQSISILYTYVEAAPPASVPEPASLALLGMGLVGAGLIRRKSV